MVSLSSNQQAPIQPLELVFCRVFDGGAAVSALSERGYAPLGRLSTSGPEAIEAQCEHGLHDHERKQSLCKDGFADETRNDA